MSATTTARTGFFWDMMEGRAPPPPSAVLLGWKLIDLDPHAGTIRVQFAATEAFLNPAGLVQGGILTAMLDETLGPCASAHYDGALFALTLELKTQFMRPGRVGPIFGEARVTHRGRDIAYIAGELKGPDGKTIAMATATARMGKIG